MHRSQHRIERDRSMTWDLAPAERDAVLSLPGQGRYGYFVKRTADWERLWGLRDDRGWVTAEDEDGRIFMPVWPHPEYAHVSAVDRWQGVTPTPIELHQWLDSWLPDLDSKDHLVAVFPVPSGAGVPVEPTRLRSDLDTELKLYE